MLGCAKPPPRFVYFKAGVDQVVDDSEFVEVGQAVSFLRENPRFKVAVIGYASSEGSAKSNHALSLKRAERVHDELLRAGIHSKRIVLAARGAEHPAAPNDTEEGRAKNRRVELFFYLPDQGSLQTQYGVRIEIKTAQDD
jgi:outer membrane protein OmpA-like peptidoglycan-associated protein